MTDDPSIDGVGGRLPLSVLLWPECSFSLRGVLVWLCRPNMPPKFKRGTSVPPLLLRDSALPPLPWLHRLVSATPFSGEAGASSLLLPPGSLDLFLPSLWRLLENTFSGALHTRSPLLTNEAIEASVKSVVSCSSCSLSEEVSSESWWYLLYPSRAPPSRAEAICPPKPDSVNSKTHSIHGRNAYCSLGDRHAVLSKDTHTWRRTRRGKQARPRQSRVSGFRPRSRRHPLRRCHAL